MELKKTLIYGAVVAALVVGTSFITARYAGANGVPGLVPVQGCATDANGNPINGSQQVEFRLYASSNASQGDALYTETRNVNFRGCVFSEMLHPTDLGIFENNPSLYLGVKIAGDAELSPRFEVGASPYAIQARHADKATNAENGVPPGTIVAFGGTTPPAGWLLCDGQVVDGAAYPELAGAIGVAWGNGGGVVGKFNLPDLRGRFLRGVDGAAGRDPDKGDRTAPMPGGNDKDLVGSVQGDSTRMPLNPFTASASGAHAGHWNGGVQGVPFGNNTPVINNPAPFTQSDHSHTILGGDKESRPKNAYVNYIIKY